MFVCLLVTPMIVNRKRLLFLISLFWYSITEFTSGNLIIVQSFILRLFSTHNNKFSMIFSKVQINLTPVSRIYESTNFANLCCKPTFFIKTALKSQAVYLGKILTCVVGVLTIFVTNFVLVFDIWTLSLHFFLSEYSLVLISKNIFKWKCIFWCIINLLLIPFSLRFVYFTY